MKALYNVTDKFPGGEARAIGRAEIEEAKRNKKAASANVDSAKRLNRPVRRALFVGAASVGSVLFLANLNENGGGKQAGAAASASATESVELAGGALGVVKDVATGIVSGTREGVDNVTPNIDVQLNNPLTLDNDPVSNTAPPAPAETVAPGEAPVEYLVVAGDSPTLIAVRCGTLAVTTAEKVAYYETVIVPKSPTLQDGMPNPGDIAVC
jgi:hypothetical protein